MKGSSRSRFAAGSLRSRSGQPTAVEQLVKAFGGQARVGGRPFGGFGVLQKGQDQVARQEGVGGSGSTDAGLGVGEKADGCWLGFANDPRFTRIDVRRLC